MELSHAIIFKGKGVIIFYDVFTHCEMLNYWDVCYGNNMSVFKITLRLVLQNIYDNKVSKLDY